MTIEEQIREAIAAGTTRAPSVPRNQHVTLEIYGFFGDPLTTLEACGKARGVTRERIRQIRVSTLRMLGPVSVPGLRRAVSILEERSVWSGSAFRDRLRGEELIGPDAAPEGVIFLLLDLGAISGYEVHDQWLRQLSPSNWLETADSVIARAGFAEGMRDPFRAALRFPGITGIAGFEDFVATRDDIDDERKPVLRYLLEIEPDTWLTEYEGRVCYIAEDRDNRLLSFSEKVFRNDGWIDAGLLAEIYRNALRSKPETYRFPDLGLIESWLRSSKWFETAGDQVRYRGVDRSRAARGGYLLRDVDRDIVAYLRERPYGEFAAMRDHLVALGHGPDLAGMAATSSSLVYVDRSRGRQHHRYILVDHLLEAAEAVDTEAEFTPYERCRRRLEALDDEATDSDTESTFRREQHILQDYLFEGRDYQQCALCGCEYGVGALVTAHKKRRSACTRQERLDPDIVMPLCVFGCDHLYENRHVSVVDGRVQANAADAHGPGERSALERLDGRTIEERWMAGKASYFARD